jgi:hypothetical protein
MLVLPMIAAAIVGLCACSSQNPGNPVASNTTSAQPTSGGSTSSGTSLASVDPCSLITQTQVTSNGLMAGQSVNAPGGRACRWVAPDSGSTINGYDLQVVIYDQAGLDKLNTTGDTVSDYTVGKYQGKLLQDTSLSNCIVSLGTTSTSRIDIYVNSSSGMDQSCQLVKEVAPKVVANFPAGS